MNNRTIYRRSMAPLRDRVLLDGGVPTSDMNNLLLLQRSNEQYKDYLKLSFCPELYGYKKDTRSGIDYITKGYRANSIQQELGIDPNSNNMVTTLTASNSGSSTTFQVVSGKKYILTISDYNNNIGSYIRYSRPLGWFVITGKVVEFIANSTGVVSFYNAGSSTYSFTPHIQEVLSNDLTQTSSANQPYLDKIAPAEKLSAKNPSGGSSYLTHPTISFGASDSWTIELCINSNGYTPNQGYRRILSGPGYSAIYTSWNNTAYFGFNNSVNSITFLGYTGKYDGKNFIAHLIANGDNTLSVYINGVFIKTNTIVTSFDISQLMDSSFYGKTYSYHIFSKALSASEVAERSSILRSIFPEIPFTRIGDQIWSVRNYEAVCTPQENLIPEVQSNTTWATSKTLYDNAFNAAGGVGGGEAAIYAGVKAAAMWCHYNNDPALGATYGKLYNWFAVKLLQMDIDYYNANNPTTPWGWRVPNQSDFNTLAAALGGASVAGGKMKTVGTTYWNSPNTGATNESGFSAIGSGRRDPDGSFSAINSENNIYGIDVIARAVYLYSSQMSLTISTNVPTRGYSLRLIKS